MTGAGFQPTAHWEILTPDKNAAVQYNYTDTDGFRLHAPIAFVAAREYNPNQVDTKLNYKEDFDRTSFIQKVINMKFTLVNPLMRYEVNNIVY